MLDEYTTILNGAEAELIEKKSRFIATVRPVKDENEAKAFIAEMRKKYWDATHNVFAYQIGERNEIQRPAMTENRREQQVNLFLTFLWAEI